MVARHHTKAQTTNEWLVENVPNYIESGPHGEWPANSPDLNPIQQVWGYMKNEVERSKPDRFLRSNAESSRSGQISMKTLCKNRLMTWKSVSSRSSSLLDSSQRISCW